MAKTTTEERAAVIHGLAEEIKALTAVEVHTETNSGTYGAAEACRKVGTGEQRFADRNVYETVGGKRRETGPAEADAPGRMRKINAEAMKRLRRDLAGLRTKLEKAFN